MILLREMWIIFWFELPTLRNCAILLAICIIGSIVAGVMVARDNGFLRFKRTKAVIKLIIETVKEAIEYYNNLSRFHDAIGKGFKKVKRGVRG